MASPKKADCTPEQWAALLKRQRVRVARPAVKARRKLYERGPGAAARKESKRRYDKTYRVRADVRARQREHNKNYARKPTTRAKRQAYSRLRNTGVTQAVFEALLVLQDNACAVCARSFSKVESHTDHCHDTKTPRGLLCRQCNIAEGNIKKTGLSPEQFSKRLAKYLAQPPAKTARLV